MASFNPTKLPSSKDLSEASSSNSRKQEKSSIGKITKTPINSQTTKNALNPECSKKVQDLLDWDIGTNSQESALYCFLRFRPNTLTVNLEQLRANLVSRIC